MIKFMILHVFITFYSFYLENLKGENRRILSKNCSRFQRDFAFMFKSRYAFINVDLKKNVNPEGECATDQAPSVEGFRNLSISSVLIVFTELGLTQMLCHFIKQ